jgi:integrase
VWVDQPSGNRPQRRAIIGTLVLGGLRNGELCGLPLDRLDLAGGRILIPARDQEMRGPQTKTAAGERVIPMVPALHDILLDARAAGGSA